MSRQALKLEVLILYVCPLLTGARCLQSAAVQLRVQPLPPELVSSGTSALPGTETRQSLSTDVIHEAKALDCARDEACCPLGSALMNQVPAGTMLPRPVGFEGLGDPALGLSPAGMQWNKSILARTLIVP